MHQNTPFLCKKFKNFPALPRPIPQREGDTRGASNSLAPALNKSHVISSEKMKFARRRLRSVNWGHSDNGIQGHRLPTQSNARFMWLSAVYHGNRGDYLAGSHRFRVVTAYAQIPLLDFEQKNVADHFCDFFSCATRFRPARRQGRSNGIWQNWSRFYCIHGVYHTIPYHIRLLTATCQNARMCTNENGVK